MFPAWAVLHLLRSGGDAEAAPVAVAAEDEEWAWI